MLHYKAMIEDIRSNGVERLIISSRLDAAALLLFGDDATKMAELRTWCFNDFGVRISIQ